MDIYEKMQQVIVEREQAAEENYEDFKRKSKERLEDILVKKIKTSFIGAIAAFEEKFSPSWGGKKYEQDLTENEKLIRKIWNDVRNIILDNGNGQIRAVKKELEQHTIIWDGFNYNFDMRNKDERI